MGWTNVTERRGDCCNFEGENEGKKVGGLAAKLRGTVAIYDIN